MGSPGEVMLLLRRAHEGVIDAKRQLAELIHTELRRLASAKMRAERQQHTLTPTALVNEVWLRLGEAKDEIENRSHFFATAATAMLRILIDHARSRNSAKRGGDLVRVEQLDIAAPEDDDQLLALDEALTRLTAFNERAARVVEMRYLIGVTHSDIAAALGVDRRTVDRDWAMAKSWLYDEVARGAAA